MPRSQKPYSPEHILLGFLYQGPNYGYDLYKQINKLESISLIWRINQSQLYALLDKLEKDGLLSSALLPGEAYPNRKEFRITPLGKQTFSTWVTTPVMHGRDIRQEFLAKLYFAQKADPQVFIGLIEGQKKTCSEWLSDLEKRYSETTDDHPYERMVFKYRITIIQAMIDWLDYCHANIDLK